MPQESAIHHHYRKRFYLEEIQNRAEKLEFLYGHKPDDFGIRLVVPSYDELDLRNVIHSLWRCDRPARPVHTTIVINFPAGAAPEVKARSVDAYRQLAEELQQNRDCNWMGYTLILAADLPDKKAGVGLARKIGMDEAAWLSTSLSAWHILVCLDADCRVAANYFSAIESHFHQNPESPGCSIFYQHTRSDEDISGEHRMAIAQYELHLRLYTNLVRLTGLPFGYHTVGSSMAVRVTEYLKEGGMSPRKAGEDFYFLQKFMKLGNFTRLHQTTVFPSARISARVPFGTGRAMTDILQHRREPDSLMTYSIETFRDFAQWFKNLEAIYQSGDFHAGSPAPPLAEYLSKEFPQSIIGQLKMNCSDYPSFQKQVIRKLDAFWIMKWANYSASTWNPKAPVHDVARQFFLQVVGIAGEEVDAWSPQELVDQMRSHDRLLPVMDT